MTPIIVYIDGQCPMCVAGANRFQKFDTAGALRFVNAREPEWAERAAVRFSDEDLNREMRAQMPDGTWRTGYFAWAAILEQLPAWRGLGVLMRFPLLYGIGPTFYKWVAAHRQEISKVLRLPPPCDENGVCRLGTP